MDRILLSGSLAKRRALRTLNDIYVALYVQQGDRISDMRGFLARLAETLRGIYPNKSHDDVTPQDHSVRISFSDTRLDVDIVSISFNGNSELDGHVFSRRQNTWMKTNIKKHLEF